MLFALNDLYPAYPQNAPFLYFIFLLRIDFVALGNK